MDKFKVIIVEDDKLELKGTQQILQTEVPEAEIIGTATGETDFWKLMRDSQPDLVLLDLGLGGSTTVGVDICRQLRTRYTDMKILVFTGEILNERLWVEVLSAGADGIILKTGNLLQRDDIVQVMHGTTGGAAQVVARTLRGVQRTAVDTAIQDIVQPDGFALLTVGAVVVNGRVKIQLFTDEPVEFVVGIRGQFLCLHSVAHH